MSWLCPSAAVRALLALALVIGLSSCSAGEADHFVREIYKQYPELSGKTYQKETVRRVVDGDTFETAAGDKVRLIGINTPEVHGKTEYYGREASEFTKQRLQGQTVYLFPDVSDTDKYGRLLRYVFIENDPVMFNETLLTEGYANTMTVPPNVMFAEKFAQLERAAREEQKGLWNEAAEAKDADASCAEPKIKGNINSRGEKIYHLPGGRYYEQTKAEMMFCTEEEALAAGFRKAKE
jgi:micrococcal nuclease